MSSAQVLESPVELVPIPAGVFLMGSPESETGRYPQEGPQTQVKLTRPFWMGKYAVTVGQWRRICRTGLLEQAAAVLADDKEYDFFAGRKMQLRDFYQKDRKGDPASLLTNVDENAPMHFVNWDEAMDFCRRLNEMEASRLPDGYEYRLPTDAEREHACRAGTAAATYAGDLVIQADGSAPVLDQIGWYAGNSACRYMGRAWNTGIWPSQYIPKVAAGPRQVGSRRPNPWGLYDMLGNVYESCLDRYADRLPGGSVTDPIGPSDGEKHVVRGGAWGSLPRLLRAAYRDGDEPTRRSMFLGFRVVVAPNLGDKARAGP